MNFFDVEKFVNPASSILFEDAEWNAEKIVDVTCKISNVLLMEHPETITAIIYLDRSTYILCSMLAVLSAGGTYVLVNEEIPEKRLNFIVKDTQATVVITESKFKSQFSDIKLIDVENLGEVLRGAEKVSGKNEIAYILYTSGSTGTPKGVCVTYKGLANFIQGMSEAIDFQERSKIACITSQLFDIFLLESIFALYMGLYIVLSSSREDKNVRLLNKMLRKHQPDILQTTPSKFALITSDRYGYTVLDSVKTLLIGGEAFPVQLLSLVKENLNCLIYNVYGPTETTIWSTVCNLTDEETVTVGKPIRNTQIYIMDSQRKELEQGTTGEICIGGDGVAFGYLNMDELTAEKFISYKGNPVFCTGDSGYINENGQLACLGRLDNQIKLQGNRIELEEIENVLMLYPGIVRAVIFANDQSSDYKHLVGVYTGESEIAKEALDNFIGQHLPPYMIPKAYHKIEEIPLTVSGKTDRERLKKEVLSSLTY